MSPTQLPIRVTALFLLTAVPSLLASPARAA